MQPWLILHGALGSAHQFSELGARISELGVNVDVLEFIGHGAQPDADVSWTMDLFVDQLEHYLEAQAWTAVRIFGYSMGGYVALELAKRRPDLVGRILTLGTKLSWSLKGAQHETRLLDPDVIAEKVPAFAADLQRRHGADQWTTVLQKTADMMIDLGDRPRLTPETMDQVVCPVRFMVGDRDEMVSLEETRLFQQATPGAELAVLPGTRHPIEKVRTDMILWHCRDVFER